MHIRKTWKTYDHYAFGGVAILGTVFAIILIEAVMMTPRWAAWEAELGQVSGPFMNVLGVLFGLTLAFLANDTWTAHDRARGAVLREADAIRRLARLPGLDRAQVVAAGPGMSVEHGERLRLLAQMFEQHHQHGVLEHVDVVTGMKGVAIVHRDLLVGVAGR